MASPSSSLRAMRAVLGHLAPSQGWEQHARQTARLRELLGKHLPPPLATACQAWVEEEGVLVLACSNGAVAAKLKQLLPRLTRIFQLAEPQVRAVRVEVQGVTAAVTTPPRPSRKLPAPPSAAPGLEAAAAAIRDPALAEAMRRLARHLRGDTPSQQG